MKKIIVAIALLSACESGFSQVSVVPPTGIEPRFLKSDRELGKQTKSPSGNWLRDANDDSERFRRIESWAGAIDGEMQVISHRFEELHAAIEAGNWDLATYHWEKIRFRMNVASMKRPARTQNLEGMFLESGVWRALNDALKAKDAEKSRAEFQTALQTCMACHIAEKVGFMNDSPVFKRLGAFAPSTK